MKWIGQHIYDLASRFRNDVYLEDISTGTIASGAHLGLDSNNKIVKAVDGGGDLTSIVAGTGLSGDNLSGPIPELTVDASQPGITTLAGLTSLGVAGVTTNIVAGDLTMYNTVNGGNPSFSIGAGTNDRFVTTAVYNSGAQTLDSVNFQTFTTSSGTNDGRYIWYVDEVELASLIDDGLYVSGNIMSNHDNASFQAKDSVASSATQGGELRLISDDGAAMGDDHRLGVIEFSGAEDASNTRVTGASIQAMCDAAWSASENGTRLEFYTMDGDASSELSLTLDSDLLATFAGAVTVTGALTGALATVNQPNVTTLAGVTALGTAGSPLTITSDQVTFASAAASDPLVNIQNTANDAAAPRLRFTKNRGGDAVDADNVGEISFWGYDDGTPSTQQYAQIKAQVQDATSGEESGYLALGVASHDGDVQVGLSIVGGDEDGEINVNLGLGANCAINIPGNIDLAGDIDVDGTLETDALTIGGAAVLAQATASAVGAVELATTAEADTGTDTVRAVTPAGLKSHVDAYARKSVLRNGAFYLNDNPMIQNNLYFGGTLGHQPMSFNDPAPLTSQTDAASAGISGIIGDPDGYTFTIANHDENWGLLLPFDISKVEVQLSMRPQNGTGDDITTAIYTGIRSSDSSAVLTLTKVAHTSVNHSGTVNRYTQCDVAVTANYNKGTMIYVGVGTEDDTDMRNGRGYMTITVTER